MHLVRSLLHHWNKWLNTTWQNISPPPKQATTCTYITMNSSKLLTEWFLHHEKPNDKLPQNTDIHQDVSMPMMHILKYICIEALTFDGFRQFVWRDQDVALHQFQRSRSGGQLIIQAIQQAGPLQLPLTANQGGIKSSCVCKQRHQQQNLSRDS